MSEFDTVCKCAANMVNERPLGTIPGPDSEISILTPYSLLFGRATVVNPGYSVGLVALSDVIFMHRQCSREVVGMYLVAEISIQVM